jgi:hypothetical protein
MNKSFLRLALVAACIPLLSGCETAIAGAVLGATGGSNANGGYTARNSEDLELGFAPRPSSPVPTKVIFRDQRGNEATLPTPLPAVKKVAVWPGGEVENRFAQKLSAHFQVTSPAVIAAALKSGKVNDQLEGATPAQMKAAFQFVCAKSGAELVFAARAVSGMSGEALAYSCGRQVVVSSERTETQPGSSQAQFAEYVATAWFDRTMTAEALGAQRISRAN